MPEFFDEYGIDQAELKRLVHYDPETGVFIRLQPPKRGSKYRVGDRADLLNIKTGYRTIFLDGAKRPAHRLAWLYVKGEFPPYLIDHENRNRGDNRFVNLRPADRAKNGWNANLKSNNTSGVTGVSYYDCRWFSEIFVRGEKHRLGSFTNREDAVRARLNAEIRFFGEFSPNAAAAA